MPNCQNVTIPEDKIKKYLLSLEHPDGKIKAKFFLGQGFTIKEWEILAEALRQHPITNNVTEYEKTSYGDKYTIECNISTPDKRSLCIPSVWIIEEGLQPKLVTAYPFL